MRGTRHGGGRHHGGRHHRGSRGYPYYYNYGYDPYWRYPYYDRYPQQPPYIVIEKPAEQDEKEAIHRTRLKIHVPTLIATVAISWLLWGRKKV